MNFIKELIPYVVIVLIVVLIRTFIVTPVRVDGQSMDNTLKDGQILILNKLDNNYKRFDIVVIEINGKKIVKRIIALPGENIEYKDNVLYIDGEKLEDVSEFRTTDFTLEELYNIEKIPKGYYFVMGDNRSYSSDSHNSPDTIGLIKKSQIVGTASVRIWPLNKIGKVK